MIGPLGGHELSAGSGLGGAGAQVFAAVADIPKEVPVLGTQAMRRSLKLALDDFGRAAVTAEAQRHAMSPEELIAQGLDYYLADRESGRPGLRVPRFARADEPDQVEMTVDAGERTWDEAETEAGRQGVALERLVEHAALYFVADLDSGQVAARIAIDAATRDDA